MDHQYKNPFHPVNPSLEDRAVKRVEVQTALEGFLMRVSEPSCISIVSEDGFGGVASVKHFLKTQRHLLPYRIVECDVASLGQGTCAADFYRELVRFVIEMDEDNSLSETATRLANEIIQNPARQLNEIRQSLTKLFEEINRIGSPLLIVFYSFDFLPRSFFFQDSDWYFLRDMHNQRSMRVYYLVVSRRPLTRIESPSGSRSLFATIFYSPLYVGLLSTEESRALIRSTAKDILNRDPWPEWIERILDEWGGRNLYCTQHLCSELFERIWNRNENVQEYVVERLASDFTRGLSEYFSILFNNLKNDGLLEPLTGILGTSGVKLTHTSAFDELELLGYIIPGNKQDEPFVLFSPLFHNYLAKRGLVKPKSFDFSGLADPFSNGNAAVQAHQPGSDLLTHRELEVLQRVARGLAGPEIARELSISKHTVAEHKKNILRKLGAHNQAEAVQIANKRKLLRGS